MEDAMVDCFKASALKQIIRVNESLKVAMSILGLFVSVKIKVGTTSSRTTICGYF